MFKVSHILVTKYANTVSCEEAKRFKSLFSVISTSSAQPESLML